MMLIGLELAKHINVDYSFLPDLETWQDMERNGQFLQTMGIRDQKRRSVKDAHLWGINMMNYLQTPAFYSMLKLAGVPALRSERGEAHPLIILGGHIWPNPLPLSKFYDLMVIGDGEEVLYDVIRLADTLQGQKPKLLSLIAQLPGVYVPGYTKDPVKRVQIDYPDPVYPAGSSYLLNGVGAVLLARGCPYNCSFCNNSYIGGRYRVKPFSQILEHANRLKEMGAKK